MAKDITSREEPPIERSTRFAQLSASGMAGLFSGVTALYTRIRSRIFELINESPDFRPLVADLREERAFIHDRAGNLTYAYPLDPAHPEIRTIVQVKKTEHGPTLINPHTGNIICDKNGPVLASAEYRVSNRIFRQHDGKIVHPNGQVAYVNDYGLVIDPDKVTETGKRINEDGTINEHKKTRRLWVPAGESEESAAEYSQRVVRQRALKSRQQAEFACERFGIDINNHSQMAFRGWGHLAGHEKFGAIRDAVVAAAIIGGGVLMFFNSNNHLRRLNQMKQQVDQIASDQQDRSR